jgi:GT2 family glycosyltransferase
MVSDELKQKQPTVSIAVPNYQQGRFLSLALDSIFQQDGINLKVAVMDAGSTDESLEVISKYQSKIHYWRSHPDDGQAAAINEGINSLGDADYVCWLNADDTYLPDGLTEMVSFLEQNPQYIMVFGKGYITDECDNKIGEYPTRKFDRKQFARICTICQPASLMRKSAWDTVGGLDSTLHMCMDYNLWWKLSSLGRLGYLEEFVACSRDHKGTKTRNNVEQYFKEAIYTVRKYYKKVPLHWYLSREAYLTLAKHNELTILEKVLLRVRAFLLHLWENIIIRYKIK